MLLARPLMLVIMACALAPGPVVAQSVAQGEALLQARCAICHAIGRTGASPNPTAPPFRDLHQRYPVEQLAESLAEGIATDHPEMPVVAFSETEVAAVIAYLQSLEP